VNVKLGRGGDEVVVLPCPELQGVGHGRERPEGNCEESEKKCINFYPMIQYYILCLTFK
jgi:hypothetical protein